MQITILFILFQKKSKIIQKPCQVVHFCKHNEMESFQAGLLDSIESSTD